MLGSTKFYQAEHLKEDEMNWTCTMSANDKTIHEIYLISGSVKEREHLGDLRVHVRTRTLNKLVLIIWPT
jgi:hypothetical protein